MTRFLYRIAIVLTVGFLSVSASLGQEAAATDLPSLKASFEGALKRFTEQYAQLDDSYRGALERLLKTETSAGNLEGAVLVRKEGNDFAAAKTFDAAAFQKRMSDYAPLNRLQTTYLNAREKLAKDSERPLADLVGRYDKELEKLQGALTRAGHINEALLVQQERKRIVSENAFAGVFGKRAESKTSFRGKALFVTKGEIEIYQNGDSVSYRNIYEGDEENARVTGESRPREFTTGDVFVIRSSSYAVYRGVILGLIAEDKSVHVPIRLRDLKQLENDVNPKKVTAEMIEAASEMPKGGSTDSVMQKEWAGLGLLRPEEGGSDWFQPTLANEWQSWGTVLTADMILPLEEK